MYLKNPIYFGKEDDMECEYCGERMEQDEVSGLWVCFCEKARAESMRRALLAEKRTYARSICYPEF